MKRNVVMTFVLGILLPSIMVACISWLILELGGWISIPDSLTVGSIAVLFIIPALTQKNDTEKFVFMLIRLLEMKSKKEVAIKLSIFMLAYSATLVSMLSLFTGNMWIIAMGVVMACFMGYTVFKAYKKAISKSGEMGLE